MLYTLLSPYNILEKYIYQHYSQNFMRNFYLLTLKIFKHIVSSVYKFSYY